jgi:hypothetical protein
VPGTTNLRLVLALPLVALFVAAVTGCDRRATDRTASTITYSARAPRPDSTATTTRTVDNAGFVDNAGRTSEQTTRTESSGMRATETGSERPTGTPGSGLPLPLPPRAPAGQVGEGAGALGGEDGSPGAPGETVVARMAQAICDRETSCNRVGPDKPVATAAQCMSVVRDRARVDVVDARCERGFDTTQLALCLTVIRQTACDASLDAIGSLTHCQPSALCSR